MKALLRNLLTGETVKVYATTDSPDSSYGLYCWVDEAGRSYGQIQFGAPFGYKLIKVIPEKGDDEAMQRQLLG